MNRGTRRSWSTGSYWSDGAAADHARHAFNQLAGAAVRFRDCFGSSDKVSSRIGFFAHGRLLATPRPLRS